MPGETTFHSAGAIADLGRSVRKGKVLAWLAAWRRNAFASATCGHLRFLSFMSSIDLVQ